MKAWQIHSYGDPLRLSEARIPLITDPNDILVKVDAASVNPIDKIMLGLCEKNMICCKRMFACHGGQYACVLGGYGRAILNVARGYQLEFPLTVGRDFSGVVIDKGHDVGRDYRIGDRVYGFVPLHKSGSHAEAVITHKTHVS